MMAQMLAASDAPRARKAELAEDFSPINFKNNMQALYFYRTLASLVVGAAVGILGVYGWHGFIYLLISQMACVAPFAAKAKPARTYFRSAATLWTEHAFSSTTLLSYVFFWMLFYNLCHVF